MDPDRWQRPAWLAGRFDVTLAVGLAALVLLLAVNRGDWRPAPLDLAACAAAALIPRWPRAAGTALGIALVLILFLPAGPSLGEYAALIPILCTGMRGERRVRLWLTACYGAVLAIRSFAIADSAPWLWLVTMLVWAALIALLWAIGNLFTNYRAALEQASSAALQQQRMALARDLHDTVARDLVRASLQGQSALAAHPSAQLESAVHEIQQASTHLRWLLALLREPHTAETEFGATSTGQNLRRAADALRDHGLLVRTFVEGDLEAIPRALRPTVQAVVGEACANMERHADRAAPCAIMMNVCDDHLDAAFFNGVRADRIPAGPGFGLEGVRERLALVGGDLVSEQDGGQWICRVSLPL